MSTGENFNMADSNRHHYIPSGMEIIWMICLALNVILSLLLIAYFTIACKRNRDERASLTANRLASQRDFTNYQTLPVMMKNDHNGRPLPTYVVNPPKTQQNQWNPSAPDNTGYHYQHVV